MEEHTQPHQLQGAYFKDEVAHIHQKVCDVALCEVISH